MSTSKHRRDGVERVPVNASRGSPVPSAFSDTPIYDALVKDLVPHKGIEWPATDVDPPTERFPALRFPDEWFDELPEVVHQGTRLGSLFGSVLVGDR